MVAKPERTSEAPQSAQAGGGPSIISKDLEIIGNLKSSGNIQIDGRIKGEIRSNSVSVSPTAHVEGSILAQSVQVGGLVKGRVEAPNVSILQSAKMLGDVVHDVLEIEGGAHFHGACQKLGKAD